MWELALVAAQGIGRLLGQEAAGVNWGPIFGSAVGSSPAVLFLFWRLRIEDGHNKALQEKVDLCQGQMVSMVERLAPLLADSTRALRELKGGLEATLRSESEAAGRSAGSVEADDLVRRLEAVLRDAQRGH